MRNPSEPRRPRSDHLRSSILKSIFAIAVLLAIGFFLWQNDPHRRPTPSGPSPAGTNQLLVCIWNVENLFDDIDDPGLIDDIEDWMGRVPGVSADKCQRIAQALRTHNGGRGPDVIGLTEVENRRALEALRVELNKGLVGTDRYEYFVHRDNRQGRRIEPAFLSRVPMVDGDPIRPGKRASSRFAWRRIVHAIITPDDRPLHLLLSHWTSRRTQNSDRQRFGYAQALRVEMDRLRAGNPRIDLLVAGDFNEEPDSPLIRNVLGAATPPPVLGPLPDGTVVNLMLGIDPDHRATMVYRGKGDTFDQILATSGLFDSQGWRVRPRSAAVRDDPWLSERGTSRPTPWRFGDRETHKERGFSDHYAVTVVLDAVGPPAASATPVR